MNGNSVTLVSDPAATAPGTMLLQVSTDANGLARAYWTLGADAGRANNRVTVTSRDIADTVYFCASSDPGPVHQINIGSGNYQKAEAGGPGFEPLRAWINDMCNGVPNVPVTFTFRQGGGKVNGQDAVTVNTEITGHAAVNLTLGPDNGTQHRRGELSWKPEPAGGLHRLQRGARSGQANHLHRLGAG